MANLVRDSVLGVSIDDLAGQYEFGPIQIFSSIDPSGIWLWISPLSMCFYFWHYLFHLCVLVFLYPLKIIYLKKFMMVVVCLSNEFMIIWWPPWIIYFSRCGVSLYWYYLSTDITFGLSPIYLCILALLYPFNSTSYWCSSLYNLFIILMCTLLFIMIFFLDVIHLRWVAI